MFCSRSITTHVLRGLAALGLTGLSIYVLLHQQTCVLLIPVMLVGAIILLRGCPMCWLLGLFETIGKRKPIQPTSEFQSKH